MCTVKSCARETGLPCNPAAEAGRPSSSLLLHDSDLSGGDRDAVLVVDDEPSVLTVLKISLEKSGFRVIVAGSGAEALAKFEALQDQIRVVITDMAMPGMNGLDLIRSIRKFDTAVELVATTGMTTPDQMRAIREAGVRHVINKPCSSRHMIELIRNLFSTP